jgi:subfamily B ATP-binding cassette protein MsbA
MGLYGRAISYFRSDSALIAVLVVLIGISVCVGLLEAWPLAILIDSVLTREPEGDRMHAVFLSFLPRTSSARWSASCSSAWASRSWATRPGWRA